MTKYGDIKLKFHPSMIGDYADIDFEDGDFEREDGLFTAILISLFSDSRVDPKNSYNGESRGFWADELIGFNLGSKLWLLGRSKLNNETFRFAEQYSKEALQWMVEDGIVETIDSQAYKTEDKRLILKLIIKRPGEDVLETFLFKLEWEAQMIEAYNGIY